MLFSSLAIAQNGPEDPENFRGELVDFFTNLHEFSPTIHGNQPLNPEALAEFQQTIGQLSPAELQAMHRVFSQVPNWNMVPELLSASLTQEQRNAMSLLVEDLSQQAQGLGEFRLELGRFYAALKLSPPQVLETMGEDLVSITQAQELIAELSPQQLAVMRQKLDQDPNWKSASQSLQSALTPAAQDALETLADAGAFNAEKIVELEEFREELLAFFYGQLVLPADVIDIEELEAIDLAIEEIQNMTPEMLYLTRHGMERNPEWSAFPETLHRNMTPEIRQDLEILISHGPIDEADRVELEEFRAELTAFHHDLAAISPQLESIANRQESLQQLTLQELTMVRAKLERTPEWGIAQVYLRSAQSQSLLQQQQLIAQAAPGSTELAGLENFRSQLAASFEQVPQDHDVIAVAKENLRAVAYDDLLMVQEMYAQAGPEDASKITALVVWSLSNAGSGPGLSFPEHGGGDHDCAITAVNCNLKKFLDHILGPFLEDIIAPITSALSTITSTITSNITTLVNNAIGPISTVVNTISSAVGNIGSAITSLPSTLETAFTAAANAVLGGLGINLNDLTDVGALFNGVTSLLPLPNNFDTAALAAVAPLYTVFQTLAPCPPVGFPIPGFGNAGDVATSDAYSRILFLVNKIYGLIPATEISAPVKIGVQVSLILFQYVEVCLKQATSLASSASGAAKQAELLSGQVDVAVAVAGEILTAKNMLTASIESTETNLAGNINGATTALTNSIVNTGNTLAGNIAGATTALTASIGSTESHLHTDIDNATTALTGSIELTESTLTTEIGDAKTMLTDSIESAESTLVEDIGEVKSMLTDSIMDSEDSLLAAIQSAGEDQTDALALLFDEHNQAHIDFEALNLRLQIERILGNDEGDRIALFQLPDVAGGYLELVRDIVAETIQTAMDLGLNIGNAQQFFDTGDVKFDDGQYGDAFSWYRKAYKKVLDS